jgi:hypothetical protein
VTGTIVLTVLGFTVLIFIPFAFTILVGMWTMLVVNLAAGSTAAKEETAATPHKFSNPLLSVDSEADDNDVNGDYGSDSDAGDSATQGIDDAREEADERR